MGDSSDGYSAAMPGVVSGTPCRLQGIRYGDAVQNRGVP